jgi:uncharacterized small protein (TIGR04563 family)
VSTRRKSADKQSLKLPTELVVEMRAEATRLEKSLSWVAQEAWRRARARIRELPGVSEVG